MQGSKAGSWWQKTRKPLGIIVIIAAFISVIVLIAIDISFYGTGFDGYNQISTTHILSGPSSGTVTRTEVYQPGKSLWEWLQLLIIPLVLAIGGSLFTFIISRNERKAADRHNQTEREIAQDNQHGAALQEYINKMSELLLHEKLGESQPGDNVRKIGRLRTLTILPPLDSSRKRIVVQFLYESGLIYEGKSIIDLSGADLIKAYLSGLDLTYANLSRTFLFGAELMGANLSGATFFGANLTSANLTGANLKEASISLKYYVGTEHIITNLFNVNLKDANLSGARLCGADLRDTNLRGADLSGADLSETKITDKQLAEIKSLKGATMP